MTPIYHPNVNSKEIYGEDIDHLGYVSFSTINKWIPLYTIRKVLKDLYAIFYWPNPDSPFNMKIANEIKQNRALFEKKVKYFTKKYGEIGNGPIYYGKIWDFSFNEKDSALQESTEIIDKKEMGYNREYNGNKTINLIFLYDPGYKSGRVFNRDIGITIQCKLKELTKDVIKRFIIKVCLEEEDILFISNGINLNPNISIGDNGMEDGRTITVIYDVIFA